MYNVSELLTAANYILYTNEINVKDLINANNVLDFNISLLPVDEYISYKIENNVESIDAVTVVVNSGVTAANETIIAINNLIANNVLNTETVDALLAVIVSLTNSISVVDTVKNTSNELKAVAAVKPATVENAATVAESSAAIQVANAKAAVTLATAALASAKTYLALASVANLPAAQAAVNKAQNSLNSATASLNNVLVATGKTGGSGKSVARLTDTCTGHGPFPPRTNTTASTNVFINGLGAHRVTDGWAVHCAGSCHDSVLASGSSTVFVNGLPLGRVGDAIECGSTIATGSDNVYAGG